ncbi:MAG TPA: HEPN domain-containing protein [Candidatus Kapabacteria bacterium]|nr:HEPN domain-containing protein [Candidatus Kapabacteria bacterium]
MAGFFMKELTLEWVHKAEEDYETILQLFIEGKKPLYSIVCFHGQQCIEKYLKVFLTESGIDFPKTHLLSQLLDLSIPLKPEWDLHRQALNVLSNFAIWTRYPHEMMVDRKIAQNAVEITFELRSLLRNELGI